jgi:hypothetical protein
MCEEHTVQVLELVRLLWLQGLLVCLDNSVKCPEHLCLQAGVSLL